MKEFEEAIFQMQIETQLWFTTIELIMVMIIIAFLGAIAVPKFTGRNSVSAGGAAEMIQADIRYTQESAMAEYGTKSVTFASGSSNYSVDSETQELPSGVIISNNLTITLLPGRTNLRGRGFCKYISRRPE